MNPNFGNNGFRQQGLPGQMMMPNGSMMSSNQGQYMNPGQSHFMGPVPGQMMMGPSTMMGMRMRPTGAPPSYHQALNQSMRQPPRGQQVNPNKGKTEEQIQKEKYFQQQQDKLKQFGKTGAATLDPNKLVDSIFGNSQPASKPKPQRPIEVPHQLKQQQQLQQQHQPATIVADDGFGDFLSSPTGNTALGPCIQTLQSNSTPSSSSSVQSDQGSFGKNDSSVAGITSVPITIATQVPVNTDKKDLTKMMMDSCDLSAPQKAKAFHKPSLKEINPIHVATSLHHTSNNARRWDQSEDLSKLFLQEAEKDEHVLPKKPVKHVSPTSKHPPKPPPWLNDLTLIPAVYKQVHEACCVGNQISTERLYPILMLSGLPKEVMGQLWTLCNKTTPGQLIEKELYQLLAVIALTQNNFKVETLDILSRCPKAPVPFLAPAGTPVPPQSPIQMTPTSPTQLTGEAVPHTVSGMLPSSQMQTMSVAQIPVQTIGQTPLSTGPGQLPVELGVSQEPLPSGSAPMVVVAVPAGAPSTVPGNFSVGSNISPSTNPYPGHVTSNQATLMTSAMTSSPATLPVTQLPSAGFSPGVIGNPVSASNDEDDFADFQTATISPPKSGVVNDMTQDTGAMQQPSVNDSSRFGCGVGGEGKQNTANLSHDLKHSTVENFFGSDDSSGSNSPDDDYYDGYKSADSKPSDSTSQFSTDQSEGEDFRNFENYLDEFQRKKDLQDKESPLHRPVSKFLGKTKSPPPPAVQFAKQTVPIKKLPMPVHVKMPATQNPPSSDEFSDFADFQSAPTTEAKSQVPSVQDQMKASGSASDLIGDEDRYAALRSLDFSSLAEEPQPDLLGEPEVIVKPQSDSDENWADFQTATNDSEPVSTGSKPLGVSNDFIPADNTSTLSATDESDWAAFETAGSSDVQASKELSGLEPMSSSQLFGTGGFKSTSIEVGGINENVPQNDDADDWAEFKESTENFSEFQSSTTDTLPKSDENNAGLVNIKRDKLDTNEILGLFKVRSDPKPLIVGRDDDDFSAVSVPNNSVSANMNKLHGISDAPVDTKEKPIIADAGKQKHMSEDDDFMKPPPMDDFHEDDTEDFGSYSRGYADIDDIVKPKIPEKKNMYGMYGLNENFVVSGHKKAKTDSSDSKNITIEVTKDSDVDNDTDSVSSKDNDVFRGKFGLGNVVAEDSQSVASLELVSNKSLQNVRDAEGNDTQSVSSNEFGNFEIGVNKDILPESKSLDSLDLRQEDSIETGSSLENSDKDSKEESPPREPEDYTKSVFGLSSSSGLPVIGDRYSTIMHDVPGSDKHAYEWQRCLDNCCRMIQDANNTFNSISSSTVCNEVIKSSQGSVYIQGVIEIYKIVRKITVTMKKSGIHSDKLTQLLKDIDLAWNNFTAFLVGGSVMPEEINLTFDHGTILSDDTAAQYQACGVCLLNVEMKSRGANTDNDNAKLTYGRRQYHASCANFWINCVDSTLPALKLPGLL